MKPVIAVGLLLVACSASTGESPADPSDRSDGAGAKKGGLDDLRLMEEDPNELGADLELLCQRVRSRSISGYSQPVYRTASMRTISLEADQPDPARSHGALCLLSVMIDTHPDDLEACDGETRVALERHCDAAASS
jgi:hypothetical protein